MMDVLKSSYWIYTYIKYHFVHAKYVFILFVIYTSIMLKEKYFKNNQKYNFYNISRAEVAY